VKKIVGAVLMMVTSSTVCVAAEPGKHCPNSVGNLEKAKVRIPGYTSGRVVVGKGRAYFYTAPDDRCRMKQVFVISGDQLDAYFDVPGWTEVTYWTGKSGEVSGWIPNSRLAETGTGMAPNYEKQ